MSDRTETTALELPRGAGATGASGACIIGDECSGLGKGGSCPEPVRCSIDWLFCRHALHWSGSVIVKQHPYRTEPLSSEQAPLMDALLDLVDAICDEMKDEVFHNDHVKAAMRRVCELIPSREPDDDDWWLM